MATRKNASCDFFRSQGEAAGVQGAFALTHHDTQTEGGVVDSDSHIMSPHKEGSARKRERMIRRDKHKRKIALVHRGRTRA
jgi:hypothetical protein